MAGKSAAFATQFLNRMLMRQAFAISGSNASTSNILVTSSTGAVPGDIVQDSNDSTLHQVTVVPDATHITVSPVLAATRTTGNLVGFGVGSPTIYVALFTTNPASDGTGFVEVSGNAYARTAITMAAVGTQWTAPAGGPPRATNTVNAVNFPTPTPSGWGTVIGVGLFTLSAAGNGDQLIWWNTTTSHVINALDTVTIAATTLIVNEG